VNDHDYIRKKKYVQAILNRVAIGKMGVQTAKSLLPRLAYTLERNKLEQLPSVLYHVTTNKSKVLRQGLKTRDELAIVKMGLGGGESNTISFTTNLKIAQDIADAFRIAVDVLQNRVTVVDLIIDASTGKGAKRKYESQLQRFYSNDIPIRSTFFIDWILQYIEETVIQSFAVGESKIPVGAWPYGKGWQGRDERLYSGYVRKSTAKERKEKEFEFVKRWLSARESSGGPVDPLFFGTEASDLIDVKRSDIAILKCIPRKKAFGWRMSSLGEWRTWTGRTIEKVVVMRS